jgi:hypothetical protein
MSRYRSETAFFWVFAEKVPVDSCDVVCGFLFFLAGLSHTHYIHCHMALSQNEHGKRSPAPQSDALPKHLEMLVVGA